MENLSERSGLSGLSEAHNDVIPHTAQLSLSNSQSFNSNLNISFQERKDRKIIWCYALCTERGWERLEMANSLMVKEWFPFSGGTFL